MLAIAYLGLILFILFIEIVRSKPDKIDFLSLFHVFFFIWYPLPAFVLDTTQYFNSNSILMLKFDNPTYTSNPQTALAIFLGYFFVLIGFYSKSAKGLAQKIVIKSNSSTNLMIYAVLLLLFACISMYIYSSEQGGLLNAISQAMLFRISPEHNLESGSKLLFFQKLTYYSFYASYLIGALIFFNKHKKYKLLLYILFTFSVIISLLAAIMESGRQQIINYFVIFYLGYALRTKKIHLKIIFIIITLSIPFILYGKNFFFSLTALPDGLEAFADRFITSIQTTSSNDQLDFYTFLTGFAYPVHSLDAAFTNNYDLRLFVDFFLAIADLIPQELFGLEAPKTILDYNSYFVAQTNEYTVPPGFLAFAIYSMSWTGLMIFCCCFGWVGRYLQTICNRHLHTICWMPFFYAITARFWTDFCGSGDPQYFIKGYFCYLTSSFVLIFIVHKTSWLKHNKHQTFRSHSHVR